MRNRRDFIKTVAGGTAGALMLSGGFAEAGAQGGGGVRAGPGSRA